MFAMRNTSLLCHRPMICGKNIGPKDTSVSLPFGKKWSLPPAVQGENPVCVTCERTTQKRLPKPKSTSRRADEPWRRIHIDKTVWSCPTVHGEHYAQVIVDDHSRKVFVQMLRRKNHDLATFKMLKRKLDVLKAPKRLAIIRADGEYANNRSWETYREDEGISFKVQRHIVNSRMGWLKEPLVFLKLARKQCWTLLATLLAIGVTVFNGLLT